VQEPVVAQAEGQALAEELVREQAWELALAVEQVLLQTGEVAAD
jgi:hypothetical protein